MKTLLLAFLALLATAAATAEAGTIPRPPPVLSPDLTDPWLVQISPQAADRLPAVAAIAPQAAAPASAQPGVLDPIYLPQLVRYDGPEPPGTIVVDTNARFLYLVMENGEAQRYGVGVGREGFDWAGTNTISRKAEWPSWTPPAEMVARDPLAAQWADGMPGGPENPLGARALYLGDTLYRIHGTNAPWTIGQAVSSGCIRMRNEDIVDLYDQVSVGTRVVVL